MSSLMIRTSPLYLNPKAADAIPRPSRKSRAASCRCCTSSAATSRTTSGKRTPKTPCPVLLLNERIAGVREITRHDKAFAAIVYPAVVRQILSQILLLDRHDPAEDDGRWRSLW